MTHQTLPSTRRARPPQRHAGPRHPGLPVEVFPFTSRFVDVDGHRLHYVDEGDGPPLVLLTVGASWLYLWRWLIEDLRGAFRCIAVDLPATGLSRAAPGFENRIEPNAKVLAHWLDTLGVASATWVVNDAGGFVATVLAAREPERFEGLVLTGTLASPVGGLRRVRPMLRLVSGRAFGLVNRSVDLLPRAIAGPGTPGRSLSREEKHAFRAPTRTHRAARNRWQPLFRDIAEADELMARSLERASAALRDTPVLLAYGDKDEAVRGGGVEALEAAYPHAERVMLEGAGHFAPVDAASELARAMRRWMA